jgi:hypothetical protein
MAGTKHEVNRIREGAVGQVIFTDANGVSTWVNPADLPAIQAAAQAAANAQSEIDTLEGVVGTVQTAVTTVQGVADAAALAAATAQSEVDTLETVVGTVQTAVTTVQGVADGAATAAAAAAQAAATAQSEVDTLETVVGTVQTAVTTVQGVADAAALAATQAQNEVDELEGVVLLVQTSMENIAAMKPIIKRVKVGTFTNMTGKTQHLIIPANVNLHSLKVYKDGLLYSEGDDYTQVSNGSGVSVTAMEAYENTEILHFEIIVTDAASRSLVTNFHATTNYTGQYPN